MALPLLLLIAPWAALADSLQRVVSLAQQGLQEPCDSVSLAAPSLAGLCLVSI